jgi:hypothetical protein
VVDDVSCFDVWFCGSSALFNTSFALQGLIFTLFDSASNTSISPRDLGLRTVLLSSAHTADLHPMSYSTL